MSVTTKGKPATANRKGMAYLLTGQSKDWGKSSTLMALTGGKHQTHCIVSKKDGSPYEFFIKRPSNTDNPEGLIDFIAAAHKNIILAFSIGEPLAQNLLQALSAGYNLRCFVLRHRWGNPAQAVTAAEMALLARFAVTGGVYDYNLQNSPNTARAAAFRAYMEAETPF
jgi:hypothetical protein